MTLAGAGPLEDRIMSEWTVGTYLSKRFEDLKLQHIFRCREITIWSSLVLLDEHQEPERAADRLFQRAQRRICRGRLRPSEGAGGVVVTFDVGALSALNGVADA
jgi:hypothetical protein